MPYNLHIMAKAKFDADALDKALKADEIPPDTPPFLWMAIRSIKQDTADTMGMYNTH